MIDKFVFFIPFKDEFIFYSDTYESGIFDLSIAAKKGVPMSSKSINYNPDGSFLIDDLKHPFESLPSSFSSMAMKIYDRPPKQLPHVQIKCSPAKLLQGHNVFGSDDPRLCGLEMLTLLSASYPDLYDMLNVRATEIREVDCTFGAWLASQRLCDSLIGSMSNVSNGQTKKREGYGTTAYFGAKNAPAKRLKVYAKSHELEYQTNELKKTNRAGCNDHLIKIHESPLVVQHAKGLARFEANVRYRMLKRLNIPTNFFDFCRYAKQYEADNGKPLTQHLFEVAFADIFKAFEGVDMTVYDDDSILEKLKQTHFTISKSGKISYTKALAAFRTYRSLRSEGWESLLSTMSRPTFYRHIKLLVDAGISKAWLQNLNSGRQNNVVPLIRVIDIDFSKQHPEGWREPVSQFAPLRLVS